MFIALHFLDELSPDELRLIKQESVDIEDVSDITKLWKSENVNKKCSYLI